MVDQVVRRLDLFTSILARLVVKVTQVIVEAGFLFMFGQFGLNLALNRTTFFSFGKIVRNGNGYVGHKKEK